MVKLLTVITLVPVLLAVTAAFVMRQSSSTTVRRFAGTMDPFHAKKDPTETMRAVLYDVKDGVSRLYLDPSAPRPVIKKRQLLIKVVASSLNPVDFKFKRNAPLVPSLIIPKPKIPGLDVSGVVVERGEEVGSEWAVGDHVVAMLPLLMTPWGAFAEYVAVDASLVARVDVPIRQHTDDESGRMSLEDAASLPLVGLTVFQALQKAVDYERRNHQGADTSAPLQGKKILIQAGAGGVGTFAIQYAKHVLGMHVATTASTGKSDFLKSLGADIVIDYRSTNFEDVIKDYDVVLDAMSWLYEARTLSSSVLKPSGHYISIASSDWAFQDGKEKSNDPMSFVRMTKHRLLNVIKRGSIPQYTFAVVVPHGGDLQQIMDLAMSPDSSIGPVIDRTYSLEDAEQAFAYLEQGHATGKVIIVP